MPSKATWTASLDRATFSLILDPVLSINHPVLSTARVSVIVPLYNGEKYLEETIQSALASSYRPIDIIIVNDGSTDNSLQIAQALAGTYPEVQVLDSPNQGVASARNLGISASKARYILCLDADDLISVDYLAEAVKKMEEAPNTKVVYCQAIKFNAQGQKPWKLKPFSRYQLARDNMIFVSALFRKSDWTACGGFSEDMSYGREDWEFWIKMLKNGGEVIQLPFIGFFYRLTPTSKRKKNRNQSKET